MPFTPAHVAAVLPVVGRRSAWVVPGAWVVGSMSPDLVYFTPVQGVRGFSHSLLGLVTVDLALGVVVLAAWWFVVGAAARDLLPDHLRRRVARPVAPRGRWMAVLAGLLLGSVTHVVWDSATHLDGRLVERVAALRQPWVGGQPVYSVLQDGSGLVGMALVAAWVVLRLRSAAPVHDDPPVLSPGERAVTWTALLALPPLLCAVIVVAVLPDFTYLVNAVFVGFTRSTGICAVAALVGAAGWHALHRRRSGAPTSG